MTTRNAAAGRLAETLVVQALRDAGYVHAERRRLRAGRDALDIVLGVPGILIDVKWWAVQAVPAWIRNAERRRVQEAAAIAVVWSKDVRSRDPLEWSVWMTSESEDALGRVGAVHRFHCPGGTQYFYRLPGATFIAALAAAGYAPEQALQCD